MVPTFDHTETRFQRDLRRLNPLQLKAFREAVAAFVDDLKRESGFRPGLRVKRVQGTSEVWEMTWAPDGRATWQYGRELIPGQPHIIWRRVGTHEVFREP